MARPLRKIAFVLEEFRPGDPGAQLLDRFLGGYPRDGGFRRLEGVRMTLLAGAPVAEGGEGAEVERRMKDFGLARAGSAEEALKDADAAVVGWRAGAVPDDALLERVLRELPAGAPCFVNGALGSSPRAAAAALALADSRGVPLAAGTSLTVAHRLPELVVQAGARLEQALIAVQGEFPQAEHEALEGLLPFIAPRVGAAPPERARRFAGEEVWRAGEEGAWSRELLAAALSRSNNVQGDPEKDGRTQDVFGLGLVPRLAKSPRAWVLDHAGGFRAVILVLDGVIADCNLAVQEAGGRIFSTQLYRPPRPNQAEFHQLAAVVESFFLTGTPPWPRERALAISAALALIRAPG
jgi:hypothetical protein